MNKESKERFVKALATFLTADAAAMSIKLQMGHDEGKRWAALRIATPLFGWPSQEEAEDTLRRWLDGDS